MMNGFHFTNYLLVYSMDLDFSNLLNQKEPLIFAISKSFITPMMGQRNF